MVVYLEILDAINQSKGKDLLSDQTFHLKFRSNLGRSLLSGIKHSSENFLCN